VTTRVLEHNLAPSQYPERAARERMRRNGFVQYAVSRDEPVTIKGTGLSHRNGSALHRFVASYLELS
jgi:hypothetical protein